MIRRFSQLSRHWIPRQNWRRHTSPTIQVTFLSSTGDESDKSFKKQDESNSSSSIDGGGIERWLQLFLVCALPAHTSRTSSTSKQFRFRCIVKLPGHYETCPEMSRKCGGGGGDRTRGNFQEIPRHFKKFPRNFAPPPSHLSLRSHVDSRHCCCR